MKREYDFSAGIRGKFHRPGVKLRLPIYLDAPLQARLEKIAAKSGKGVGEMVNQMVKREVKLVARAHR